MALTLSDLTRQRPALLLDQPIIGLSTDDDPAVGEDGGALEVGATWLHEDTGVLNYYDGSQWKPIDFNQERGLQTALLFRILEKLEGDE